MEDRIKNIYNDCWKIYKQYLSNHDMGEYNTHAKELIDKYGQQADIVGIVFWWSARVQGLHDAYMKTH